MKIKNFVTVATILITTQANSQITQVEAFGGFRGSGLTILMNQPIDEKKLFSFVSLSFFQNFYSKQNSKLDENAILGAVFYNIGKGLSVGAACAANNLGGFQKRLSF